MPVASYVTLLGQYRLLGPGFPQNPCALPAPLSIALTQAPAFPITRSCCDRLDTADFANYLEVLVGATGVYEYVA